MIDSVLDYFKLQTVANIKIIQEKQAQFPTISVCGTPSFNNFTIDQLILSVSFEGVLENNFSLVFEEYIDTVWGKCFRYNSAYNINRNKKDVIKTTVYGKPNNLRISFNLDGPDDFREILFQIHNHSSPPYDLEIGGYWLKTGSVNYFGVERVFTEKLPDPYNDCLKDENTFKHNKTLINKMKELEKSYSQDECYRLCSHLFSMQESNCNCETTFENFATDCLTRPGDPLFNSEIKKCVANYLKTFRVKEQFEKCQKFCPKECVSMSHIMSSYFELIPISGILSSSMRKISDFEKFKTYEEIHEHYIRVYVYYKDLKYTLISENPKTEPFNFISSIGGILGLFLGISFLSFIEMFEIIFEIIFYLITK